MRWRGSLARRRDLPPFFLPGILRTSRASALWAWAKFASARSSPSGISPAPWRPCVATAAAPPRPFAGVSRKLDKLQKQNGDFSLASVFISDKSQILLVGILSVFGRLLPGSYIISRSLAYSEARVWAHPADTHIDPVRCLATLPARKLLGAGKHRVSSSGLPFRLR